MNMCYEYSVIQRYEFKHVKRGIVTFREAKRVHCQFMREHDSILGNDSIKELYEYKNFPVGVMKNYIGSFSSIADENIDETWKKAGIIFSSNFDRQKVNPLIYIIFWRHACLPTLLCITELFTLTPSLLTKLESCQQWFLKNIFYFPKLAPRSLLLRLSGLNSVEFEISIIKLLFGVAFSLETIWHLLSEICFKLGLRAFLTLTSSPWVLCPAFVRPSINTTFSFFQFCFSIISSNWKVKI